MSGDQDSGPTFGGLASRQLLVGMVMEGEGDDCPIVGTYYGLTARRLAVPPPMTVMITMALHGAREKTSVEFGARPESSHRNFRGKK